VPELGQANRRDKPDIAAPDDDDATARGFHRAKGSSSVGQAGTPARAAAPRRAQPFV
jgi:hypothetical protein